MQPLLPTNPLAPRLGYWDIRGLAHPIRCLLAHVGIDFFDIRYKAFAKEDGTYDTTSWTSVKASLGLDFPNNPYYIEPETGLAITESGAIIRHIAEGAGKKKKMN
jgi:glutathione S-transferase